MAIHVPAGTAPASIVDFIGFGIAPPATSILPTMLLMSECWIHEVDLQFAYYDTVAVPAVDSEIEKRARVELQNSQGILSDIYIPCCMDAQLQSDGITFCGPDDALWHANWKTLSDAIYANSQDRQGQAWLAQAIWAATKQHRSSHLDRQRGG
ncbi:MAG: hypothetical protein HC893_03525 [Chloroflexaceae bacterium]|nr:hypothetical protein [Chloroflexaceae bacterium]